MRLKGISNILVLFLALFPTERSGAQEPAPAATEYEQDSLQDSHSVRLQVPLGLEFTGPDFAFVVEKPKKAKIPLQLAARLFSETVGAVMSVISPNHKLRVRLFLALRLGQKSDSVTVHRGNRGRTVICMRQWNDVLFAEMLARAVPGSIVSESELDDAAHLAVRRARATVSIDELQSKMTIGRMQPEQ